MKNYIDVIFKNNTGKEDVCALVDRNGERKTTWGELYAGACQIASLAAEKKLSGIVPVFMPRCAENVITMLGLGLAGLGVSPLSDHTPEARVKFIEEQTGNCVWTEKEFNEAMALSEKTFKAVEFEKNAPAYIVYTSGSTGTPKGVMLSNETVVKSYMRMASEEFLDLHPTDVVLQNASFSFVALMIDLFAPLYKGCVCHILPEAARLDTAMMTEYVNAHGITSMFITPKPLSKLGAAPSLRVVCVGGERVSNLGPKGYRLLNVWGMSETAAIALGYNITEPMEITPIGKSMGDFRTYILDENGALADEGELCLSGAVATGYYKCEDLTAENFEVNPFSNDEGHEILMHTGDIVRRRPDGNLVYLNRKDFMIKINGQRVEPGEAEAVLERIQGIKSAAVKGFTEKDGHSYLCAYYVSDKEFDEEYLKDELGKHLPGYMIPSFYVKLDALPLNSNGKLDRRALAAPALSDKQSEYEEAKTETEHVLCRAFEKVLGLERVGVNDDFLRLGGDSIRAMSVVALSGIKGLRGADILSGRTPRGIADIMSENPDHVFDGLPENLDCVPLTDSQMGVYLECVHCPESTMYNIPVHLSFSRNGMSREQVKDAINLVISKHPALLSRIDGECMVREPMDAEGICKAFDASESDVAKALENPAKPFELSKAPLCRASAYLTDEKVHILMDIHHLVADGTSVSILARQICAALAGERIEQEKPDAFSLYEAEQRIISVGKDAADAHFRELLAGVETDSNLIFDKKPQNGGIMPSKLAVAEINNIDLSAVKAQGITESSFFMGVFGYTLAKMTGQTTSLFVAGENGRKSAALSNTVAMLVRTLPVVMNIDEKQSAFEVLSKLQEQFFSSVRNDCCSFAGLANEYGINSDVSFVYQSDMLSGFESPIGHTDIEILPTGCAFANLSSSVLSYREGYVLKIEYRSDLYTEKTIERFIKLYKTLAAAFSENTLLEKINIISEEDVLFLDLLNNNEQEYNKNETMLDIFRRKAEEIPDKTLVVSGDVRCTYGEADKITDRLAAYIHSLEIGRKQTVSVLIPRCEYMVLASLGIMKSGAMYQPLDPSYPPERLSFMRKDADSKLLIADRELIGILADFEGPVLYTDEIPSLPDASLDFDAPKPDDGCVLLYTSGTTGTPKGCMITHGNIVALAVSYSKTAGLDADSRATAYASYGFDAHMADIYPTIFNGGEIHIIHDDIRLDLGAMKNYCEANGITNVVMTTQICRQFATDFEDIKGLKCMLTGGEKLVSFTPKGGYRFINAYGPTECTVMGTAFHVDKLYDDIPIGKAIPNFKLYVVDAVGRRLPVGAPGELVMCGPQVAKGYLNREEQTNKVFIPNTFENNPGEGFERCYKTGDIVRFMDDGNIAFIGRQDMQVKIRGFRIELGEVERVIRQYPGITDATLIARDDPSGGKCLHAYIVSKEKVDIEKLNEFIRSEKPPYMVPAATMQIDKIPLTPNQKVDKKKLPVMEVQFENVTKPENALQQRIFDKIAEVVGTDNFGIETDIFLAGVSSIGSIKLCSLLAEELGIPVQIRNLKKYSTVKKLEKFAKKSQGIDSESTAEADGTRYSADHPISKTMEGIFTECIVRSDSTFYNVPYLVKLSPKIDEEKLKRAIVSAVEAHPYMKTELYTDSEGRVRQHRRINDSFTSDRINLINAESIDTIRHTLVKPFKITDSALFDISLIHADGLYLFLNFHHIITDGTSIFIFLNDVESAYAGDDIKSEAYSGFDVAEDEQRARTKEDLAEAKEYYASLLEGLDRDFLPLGDRYQHMEKSRGRLIYGHRLTSIESIKRFCEKNKVSMNAFFTSVFGFVLSRYAGTDYSVFNTVYNGRNDSRTADTFAMLVKTLPVVCNVEAGSPKAIVTETGAQLMDSMANDLFSYAEIARSFDINNDVMFIYQGDSFERSSFCGEAAEEIYLSLSDAKSPLALQVVIKDGQVVCDLEYDPERFTEKLMSAFLSAYDMACAGFAEEKELRKISLLSPEMEAEMEKYNDTEFEYDRNCTVTDLFLDNVEKTPDKLCIVYKNKKLTYADVGRLTGKAALFLMDKGIGRGDVVSILINRDENMVVTAHSVIRAGAAYVGLDPTYPSDRLEFMIKDSGSKYLIADRSLVDKIPGYVGAVLYTDEIDSLPELSEEKENELRENEKYAVSPENDALIIYSSGTTGLPKGSVLQQKAIICFYNNYIRDMLIDENSHVAAYASFGFDGGAQDVFSIPMVGGTLFVIPDEIRLDMKELEQFYVRNAITSGFMTTQVGTMFISATKCRTLRAFTVGGEKLIPVMPPENVRFFNGYGPSETMCYVNRHIVTDTAKLQPIGKTNGNIKEYIIDKFGNRQPFGANGELCISGGQMGRGYLNRPEKTAEVFVANPFCNKAGYERMYLTGDVVRMLPDGNYDFVGRNDGQVKIRGFRVELSEVEQQIRKYDGVTKTVVTAFDSPAGGKYLAAYVVSENELDTEALRKFIAAEKPDYMVPAVIMRIDGIPLTSNGKVDMRKLPKAELESIRKGAEPADETEENICAVFGEVLGLDKVYADDDFFTIGGSSISAIQVIVKCEQAGMAVVYKNLFANPTPQKLAAFLSGGQREDIVASNLEKGDGHNYSALQYNIQANLPKIRNNGVGDVLLTGTTGFLGSHVFRELLTATDSKVICIVRSKPGMSAEERLKMMMVYYFEDWYSDKLSGRVTVIDGDMEKDETRNELKDIHFDTIINCAANVKHFAAGDELMNANFTSVEKLISIAEEKGAKLIQISSLSVCGESVNGSVPANYRFKETDLNIGQSLENKYIYTKYLAEQALIDAVSSKRVRGKVIRLGNLMARADDSQFQVNAGTNGFLRMFLGFSALGCFPIGMMDAEIEFSPIDAVAKAVVLLAGTPDEFTVFHAKNCNTIHYGYFLNAIRKLIRPIELVEDDVFEMRLERALENEKNVDRLGGLLAYRNEKDSTMSDTTRFYSGSEKDRNKRIKIGSDTTFTVKSLYRLGFAWPLISSEYLNKMVEALSEMNYFSDEY